MKIDKQIDNPHVFGVRLRETFGEGIEFFGSQGWIELQVIPEGVLEAEVATFIENWADETLDEDVIAEEIKQKEIDKLLKMLDDDKVKEKIKKTK